MAQAREETRRTDRAWLSEWGQLLRIARQVSGLSLSALSARTGLSKGYLSKLESGHPSARNPSRATLAALARALPSFRPLANMLEPGEQAPSGALAEVVPNTPLLAFSPQDDADRTARVGWPELEVLTALWALDRAAVPTPISALTIARAASRPVTEIEPVLAGLVTSGVVRRVPPTRPGGRATYACETALWECFGIEHLGDMLILAGALLARPAALAPITEDQ